ncbi:hypothetical protein LAZ67_4001840 [Cordylochernes scorpioides]|uniref:Uncharacterized protein n=1 Tax=Cordylochernes scorpioides TaxID=51811 RepID=A0ABY6KFC4_9ARAC|nr:hypothetical protein LAZ67_4001840 [Cordylochernes scorpioides]
MDETWVYHYTSETKQQSKLWVEAGVSAPKKAKSIAYAGKVMANLLGHSSYSPDLAPSDIHLFPNLWIFVSGKSFNSNKEVERAFDKYYNGLPDKFRRGILILEKRWTKAAHSSQVGHTFRPSYRSYEVHCRKDDVHQKINSNPTWKRREFSSVESIENKSTEGVDECQNANEDKELRFGGIIQIDSNDMINNSVCFIAGWRSYEGWVEFEGVEDRNLCVGDVGAVHTGDMNLDVLVEGAG